MATSQGNGNGGGGSSRRPLTGARGASSAGGGSFFTKKYGPLPGWGWIAVAIVGLYLYRKYTAGKSATAAAAPVPTAAPTAASGGVSPVIISATPGGGTATFNPGAPGGQSPSPGSPATTPNIVAEQQAALAGSYSAGGYTQGMAEIPGQGTYYAVQPGQTFPKGTETYGELTPNTFTPIPGNLPNFAGQQYVLQPNAGGGYQMG